MNASELGAPAVRSAVNWSRLVWSLRILLAVIFLLTAIPKLAAVPVSVSMFHQIGLGLWFMYFVGAVELAGAVGLLVPRLAGVAAVGLCADMLGASIVNVAILHSGAVVLTVVLFAVCGFVALSHRSTISTLAHQARS